MMLNLSNAARFNSHAAGNAVLTNSNMILQSVLVHVSISEGFRPCDVNDRCIREALNVTVLEVACPDKALA